MFDIEPKVRPVQTRYMRTTWSLKAEAILELPDASKVRLFKQSEADELFRMVSKRNVFSRHSWGNIHYLDQVRELQNRTVIEVLRTGYPIENYEQAGKIADLIEKLVILSTTLVLPKADLLRNLGISSKIKPDIDFAYDNQFQHIKSRSQPAPAFKGLSLDEQTCSRFRNCGFFDLFQFCQRERDLEKRVNTSVDWLFESRREIRLPASVVKTAIALESLLIFSESEALARSLSERAAFILSSCPITRQVIAHTINQFYEVRSGVVHGSAKKVKKLTPNLVESVDRLVLLMYLTIAGNSNLWPNVEALRIWCEKQRWGSPSPVKVPFKLLYLKNALSLVSAE